MRYATVLLAAGLMVAADTKDDVNKELEKFSGAWTVVSVERGGQKTPADMVKELNLKLVIKGDVYEAFAGENSLDKGTLKVDGSKTPKAVDVLTKGMTILAIYEFNGDEMKCCYDLSGKERPKEFKTAAGTMQMLAVYKKQK